MIAIGTARADTSGMSKPVTKPGAHGTLYLYELTYTDESDPGIGELKQRMWAYSLEHVSDKFYTAEDADGWTLLRAARVPVSGGMHRATQHDMGGA